MDYELELITNNKHQTFYKEIKEAFKECKSFFFSVAFITYSGLQILLNELSELNAKGVKGKIITTDYLQFTDASSLKKLLEFENIETKIFIVDNKRGFHTKGYIFEYEDFYKVFIGSSNITQNAFKVNVEWNVKIISKKDDRFVNEVLSEFDYLMKIADVVDDDFIDRYNDLHNIINSPEGIKNENFKEKEVLKPNAMQLEVLDGLDRIRKNGDRKALLISATATGKTYATCFDVKREKPDTMLFLVHNENILKSAKESFEKVINDKLMGFYTGNVKDKKAEYLFATVATLSKEEHYTKFDRKYFKYIIIDEAHRAASNSYSKVLNYFEPDFLLGMTATPERTDGGNIYKIFDYNIAAEIRLREALEKDLVVPFHYFGIEDATADLKEVDITNIDVVAKKLMIKARVDLIIEKMLFYGFQGKKRKCIGFCTNREHAKYMSEEFCAYGYNAIYLIGENSIEERQRAIENLENDDNPLEFIFTVDVFNEGVDIKTVNLILMLRPTESAIIFTQQLGRGLRKAYNKEFLTVLDFIGNHNKTFLIPIALCGSKFYDSDSLKVAVAEDFSNLPGCTNIVLAKKTKNQILKQLDNVRFSSIKYLRDEYMEFKKMFGGKIPCLVDYIVDNAPDPYKFIREKKNYLLFLKSVDKDVEYRISEYQENLLNWISGMIPLKRIYDFVILSIVFECLEATIEDSKQMLAKYLDNVDEETIKHSYNYLSGKYFDSSEQKKYSHFFKIINGTLVLTDEAIEEINSTYFYEQIEDVIQYGILRYEREFGRTDYGMPFLKLYQTYSMRDLGLLSNYEKIHSSIRGQGVWRINEHAHCFFVNLHKNENIKDSINYKDRFIDTKHFQWQSPNNTPINGKIGQEYANNVLNGIDIYLFVRKQEEIEKNTAPFIYVGKIKALKHEGEKPITILYELEVELPENIYNDLTKIIGDEDIE